MGSPYTLTRELTTNYPGLKEFQSVTEICVIKLGEEEYVTFDGNGRSVGLLWAFPEGDDLRNRLNVEVLEYVFDDAKKKDEIANRIAALQESMGSKVFMT